MIIPIRCFSCNKVIGDKYAVYLALNNKIESDTNLTTIDTKTQGFVPVYGASIINFCGSRVIGNTTNHPKNQGTNVLSG